MKTKKPQRFIIEVWDDIAPNAAFYYAMKVAESGLISTTRGQKHHCFHTAFHNGTHVSCNLNAGSERFQISRGG